MYEDENNLYHYSYRKGDEQNPNAPIDTKNYAEDPWDKNPGGSPKKKGGSGLSGKIVALARQQRRFDQRFLHHELLRPAGRDRRERHGLFHHAGRLHPDEPPRHLRCEHREGDALQRRNV